MEDHRTLHSEPVSDKGAWATDTSFRVDEYVADVRRRGKIPAPCATCAETTSQVAFIQLGRVGSKAVLQCEPFCEQCVAKARSLRRTRRELDCEGQEFLVVTGLRPVEPHEVN